MEAGIFKKVMVDNGRQVLMVGNMFCENHEGYRYIGNSNGGDVLSVHIAKPFKGFDESKLGYPFHSVEGAEVENFQGIIAGRFTNQGENQGYYITRDDTKNKGNQLHHFLTLDGKEDDGQQRYQSADEIDPSCCVHYIGRHGICETKGVSDGIGGQRQTDDGHSRPDDNRRHELSDPGNTGGFHNDRDNNIDQPCKGSTDYETGKPHLFGCPGSSGSFKCGRHGTKEGKA